MSEHSKLLTTKSPTVKYLLAGFLIVMLFIGGWLGGRFGSSSWATVKQAIVDSYLNRYRIMSDSGLDSIVYYVSTKDRTVLDTMALQSPDIVDVAATRIKNLYDVRISYASRVPTVKSLRAIEQIDAVITVPLFCH